MRDCALYILALSACRHAALTSNWKALSRAAVRPSCARSPLYSRLARSRAAPSRVRVRAHTPAEGARVSARRQPSSRRKDLVIAGDAAAALARADLLWIAHRRGNHCARNAWLLLCRASGPAFDSLSASGPSDPAHSASAAASQAVSARCCVARALMEALESDGEALAPLRAAFGGRKDPVALVAQALDVASRLPAHAAGDTPAVLAKPLQAARKEQGAFAYDSGVRTTALDPRPANRVPN